MSFHGRFVGLYAPHLHRGMPMDGPQEGKGSGPLEALLNGGLRPEGERVLAQRHQRYHVALYRYGLPTTRP